MPSVKTPIGFLKPEMTATSHVGEIVKLSCESVAGGSVAGGFAPEWAFLRVRRSRIGKTITGDGVDVG